MSDIQVVHGDALCLLMQMPDESVDAIITDPPYGVDYQSARRTDKSTWKPKIRNDKAPYVWWLKDAFRVLKNNCALLCFTRYDTEQDFRWAMRLAGFTAKAQIVWDKQIHGMGDLKGDFAPQHENIIFATKGRFTFPGKRPKSVVSVQRVHAESLKHPNEKPIALLRYLVRAITPHGGTVLDPFAGSGTTLLAAQALQYNAIGYEIEKNYFDLITNSLQSHSISRRRKRRRRRIA